MNFSRSCELNFIPSLGLDLPGLPKAGWGQIINLSSYYHLSIGNQLIRMPFYSSLCHHSVIVIWPYRHIVIASHFHLVLLSYFHFHHIPAPTHARVTNVAGSIVKDFGWLASKQGWAVSWWLASGVEKRFISGAAAERETSNFQGEVRTSKSGLHSGWMNWIGWLVLSFPLGLYYRLSVL